MTMQSTQEARSTGPSVLYVPASKPRAIEKAKSLSADAIILDLEDAVHADEKVEARRTAAAALGEGGFAAPLVAIRVNGHDTSFGSDDFAMVRQAAPDAVVVPKVNDADDVARYAEACRCPLWAMIETPLAILNIRAIAEAADEHGLKAFVLGANDLAKDADLRLDAARTVLLPTILHINLAARAYGLSVFDSVYNDFKDTDGLWLQCQQARDLGLAGKTLIHPSQIEICHAAFAPSEAEVQRAERLVEIFERPENKSLSVISIDGEMFERLHLENARRIVSRARS